MAILPKNSERIFEKRNFLFFFMIILSGSACYHKTIKRQEELYHAAFYEFYG